MADQPTVVVVGNSQPNTEQNSEPQPSEERQQRESEMLVRFGELKESYRQLEARLASSELGASELAALRSELSAIRSELAQLKSDLQEPETPGDVVLVTPEPEPTPAAPELPPVEPKKPWLKVLLEI